MADALSSEAWWGRVNANRRQKREMLATWRDNVLCRLGKPFRTTPPEDTVNVPADWSRTKNKIAQTFYQVPEIKAQGKRPEWEGTANVFAAALNHELSENIHAEFVMHECLADVINASGIMAAFVSYEASFEDVPMEMELPQSGGALAAPPAAPIPGGAMGGAPMPPSATPDAQFPEGPPNVPVVQGEVMPEGGAEEGGETPPQEGAEQTLIPRAVYECYKVERVSPAHLVWPVEFVGSDWKKAPYLGREGYLPLAEAQRRGWVDANATGVQITDSEWYLIQQYADLKASDEYIKFVEIFYRPYHFDSSEKDPRKIKRVVLIETGKGEGSTQSKVVDEDFKWQKYSPETRKWVGMKNFPIKVGTIVHVSDVAVPPSDSEIGRPQVREMIKSRTQMVRQRDHSMPLRWFDVNQVDPIIGEKLRRGKWQDMIPMNGPGDHAIGEVARAQYPQENWNFDRVIKSDLDEAWSMGNMQQGFTTPGETTATEVKEISGANDVRLDFEKQWVVRFFLEIAEGVGELMQMFQDDEAYAWVVGENGVKELKAWNRDQIPGEYVLKIRPDSQLRIDVSQRRNEGLNLYKLMRKDPMIDPGPLVRRVLEDHGFDVSKMMAPQQPPKPDKPRISASIKGEDLLSPLAVALVNKSDTPVTPQDIEAAKALIQAASVPPPEPQMPGGPAVPGQPPTNPGHGGTPPVVESLDRRYEQGGDHGVEGSRDSAFPTGR